MAPASINTRAAMNRFGMNLLVASTFSAAATAASFRPRTSARIANEANLFAARSLFLAATIGLRALFEGTHGVRETALVQRQITESRGRKRCASRRTEARVHGRGFSQLALQRSELNARRSLRSAAGPSSLAPLVSAPAGSPA
jgi:hypothetical protein